MLLDVSFGGTTQFLVNLEKEVDFAQREITPRKNNDLC